MIKKEKEFKRFPTCKDESSQTLPFHIRFLNQIIIILRIIYPDRHVQLKCKGQNIISSIELIVSGRGLFKIQKFVLEFAGKISLSIKIYQDRRMFGASIWILEMYLQRRDGESIMMLKVKMILMKLKINLEKVKSKE